MSDASKLHSPFQPRSVPDGVYASCYNDFSNGTDSLSQLDYPADFLEHTEPWVDSSDKFTTHFMRSLNEPPTELTITLFGEVLDGREGTALGAMGSATLRNNEVAAFVVSICCILSLTQRVTENHIAIKNPRQNLIGSSDRCQ